MLTPPDFYSENCMMVCSDDDPYMSLNASKELANKLGCELKVLEKGGHINSDSGFGPWPWALEYICNLTIHQRLL